LMKLLMKRGIITKNFLQTIFECIGQYRPNLTFFLSYTLI
jgi:hypothetical protein